MEGEGLKGLSHSGRRVPVKAQPVALEHTGELGPGVFQALQEVFLMERADPRGSLEGGAREREGEVVLPGSQRARPTPAQGRPQDGPGASAAASGAERPRQPGKALPSMG